jgi:hypothetical protein
VGFLDDRDFSFAHLPPPFRRTRDPSTPPQDDDDEDEENDAYALAYQNDGDKDIIDNFIACVFHD